VPRPVALSHPGLAPTRTGYEGGMLRKLLWTGLYAGIGAGATVLARRISSRVWRVATGEEPPTKK
jgi:hypothetical protein